MERIFITGSSYFVDKHIKECLPDTDDISLEIYFGDELDKTALFELNRIEENNEDFLYKYIGNNLIYHVENRQLTRYVGDYYEFQRIYEANKDKIKDPSVIRAGQVLTIPSLKGELREGTYDSNQTYSSIKNFSTNNQRTPETTANEETAVENETTGENVAVDEKAAEEETMTADENVTADEEIVTEEEMTEEDTITAEERAAVKEGEIVVEDEEDVQEQAEETENSVIDEQIDNTSEN